ncbi:MAG: hypothetical protein AAFQ17_00005 [Pseudomonadota bacterium]
MLKDMHHGVEGAIVIPPAVYSADVEPDALDLQGYTGCEVFLTVGVGGITFNGSNRIEFILEDSDDNTAFEAVRPELILGAGEVTDGIVKSLTSAHAAAAVYRVGYVGYRRYLRLRVNFNGSHGTGTAITASAILGPMKAPVPDQI